MSKTKYNNQKKSRNNVSFDKNIIVCNEGNFKFEDIKNGYIQMSKINLQIARECESELVDVKEYETWLYGVWFYKWQQW